MRKKIALSGIFALVLLAFSLQVQAMAPGPAPTPPPAPDPYASCRNVTKGTFYSPEYLILGLSQKWYPYICGTSIHVGGGNIDAYYFATDTQAMIWALQGGASASWNLTPEQMLNQEYVAAQLGMLQFSYADYAARQVPLKCYGFTTSLLLGNGHLLTPDSKLGALFDETYWAFKENRREDYLPLWNFFWRLNGGSGSYPAYNYKGTVENAVYCCQEVTDQGNGIVDGSHCRPIEPWERSSRCQGYSFSCTGEMVSPAGVAGCKVVP
jgi:hypothetical protein